MQIIGELEGEARGAYTGSFGYLNADGDMDFNILIRTATLCRRRAALSHRRRHRRRFRLAARAGRDPHQGAGHAARLRSRRVSEPPRTLINGEPGELLSSRDRGLQYGDGLFETMRCEHGRPRWFERHLARLALGCDRLGMAAPDGALLRAEAQLLAGSAPRALVKIILTRGTATARGYRPAGDEQRHAHRQRPRLAGRGQRRISRRPVDRAASGSIRGSPASSTSIDSSRCWRSVPPDSSACTKC